MKTVKGTNCSNCLFAKLDTARDLPESKQDAQGGRLMSKDELRRAKEADLITLPGDEKSEFEVDCAHPDVDMPVTKRMCCAYWDAEGVIRQFHKTIKKQYRNPLLNKY